MDYSEVARLLRLGRSDELRSLAPAQWRDVMRDFLASETATESGPNADALVGLGVMLAQAGFRGIDGIAIEWLAEQPDARRLDVASTFLAGYWNPSPGSAGIDSSLVAALIAARGQIPVRYLEADFASIVALSRAYPRVSDAGSRTQLRRFLESTLREPMAPDPKRELRIVVERALHSSAHTDHGTDSS